jgi:SAM-dependent methyltransferase
VATYEDLYRAREVVAAVLATRGVHRRSRGPARHDRRARDYSPRTLLELGSGGGSLASHLKARFALTLTDVSPQMLEVNRALNPDAEFIAGDMRSLRLPGRMFDLVLIHDAIMYATEPDAVIATMATATLHCKEGGLVIIVPDHVRETFAPDTECGGEDAEDGRGFRYLQWTWDPDPSDHTFDAMYSFLMREPDGTVTVEGERHTEGLFSRADWVAWMEGQRLTAKVRHDAWARDVFVGVKAGA